MQVKNMLAALTALALTAATAIGQSSYFGPSLPVTNITVNGTISLKWDDYSDIVGFQLYTTFSLETPDWQPMTDIQTGLMRMGTDATVFSLTNTVVTLSGDSPTSKQFYRLVAVKGKHKCVEIITVGEGEEKVHYIQIGKDPDVYIEVDGEGNAKKPLTYWKDINSTPRTQVWDDSNGGWADTLLCLCVCGLSCNCPCHLGAGVIEYPLGSGNYYKKVQGSGGQTVWEKVNKDGSPKSPREYYGSDNGGDPDSTDKLYKVSDVDPDGTLGAKDFAETYDDPGPNFLTEDEYQAWQDYLSGAGGSDEYDWGKVLHTIMIDLAPGANQFKVTKYAPGSEPNVSEDALGKTDHLYLRYIDGGTFVMGSPANEFNRTAGRETQTTVTLNSGFYISVYAITDHQYNRVMTGATGAKTPKISIAWNTLRGKTGTGNSPSEVLANPSGATSFLSQLKDKVYTASGNTLTLAFDLPSEAQWEFACRAGTSGTFSYLPTTIIENTTGRTAAQMNALLLPTLGEYARYTSNSSAFPQGGTRLPNPAGLYDMHGGIWEWCRDALDTDTPDLPGGSVTDRLRTDGDRRVLRGGAWGNDAVYVRSAYRHFYSPANSGSNYGFRLCAPGAAVP